MGYLDDVIAHLATRRAGSGLHQDPKNALWDILQGKLETAAPDNAAWHSSRGGGTSIGDVAGGAWNAVGKAIDFVERPFYAGAGVMEAQAKQGGLPVSPFVGAPAFLLQSLQGKNKGVGEAFWKGLSGQEKKSFGDVTAEVAKHPGALGDIVRLENKNPISKFTMNMAGDVAFDPLTYTPPGAVGAVSRGIARPAFGLAGKELPKILEKGGVKAALRTKNPVKTHVEEKVSGQFKDAATPEQAAVDSLNTTGAAKVNSTVSDKAVAKFNEPQLPGFEPGTLTPEAESNVAKLTAQTGPLSLQPGHGILAPAAGKAAERISTSQAALAAHRAKAAAVLAPFEHARYGEDLQINPFHMTEPGVPKKILQDVEKTREIPISGSPEEEVAKSIPKFLHPATYDDATKSYMALDHKGNPLSIGGVDINIPAKHLHDLATKGGELSAVEKKAHVQLADGKTVPVQKVVNMLKDQAETAKLIGKQTKTEKYTAKEVVEQPTTRRRKLSPFERLVWEHQAEQVLHPEDVTTLRQAGMKSFKQYDEALAAVRQKVDTTQYGSLDELAAAVADGSAPKAVTDELKKRLGSRGKLETLIKNLKTAEERVTKQQGAVREAEAKAYSKTPASKYEAKNGLPSPEGHPEVMTEAANVAEKAVAEGTPPKASLAQNVPIDAWQSETVTNAVKNSFKSEFGDPATWEHMSKTGANKEAPGYYEKRARWIKGFNKRSSIGIVKDLIDSVTKRLEGMAGGKAYNTLKYDTLMPMLRASEQVMRKEGIQPILGGGRHGRGIPMSMHDVLESLPRDFVEKYMFDKPWKGESWNFAPTQLADIAEQFVHLHLGNKDLPTVEAAVREILKKPLNAEGYKAPITRKIGRVGKDGKDRYEPLVKEVMDAFTKATPKLGERLTENIAQTAVDEHGIAKALTDEAISNYAKAVSDPRFSPGTHIQAALERHKFVDEAARAANVNPASAAKDLADQAMDAHVAETMPIGTAKTIEKSTAQLAKATTKDEAVHAAVTVAKGAQDEATVQILKDGDNYIDYGNQAELGLALGWMHRMVPDAGSEDVHRDLLNYISAAQTYVKDHANVLAGLHQKYPNAQELEQAWNQLKSWEPGQLSTPAMDDLMVAVKDALEVVPEGKFGWFTRNVKDPNLLMEDYDHFGVRQHHGDISLNPDDMENSWRSWEPGEKGILDLISRVNASHTYAVAKHTMGADFTSRFAYDKAGPGLVKIIDSKGTSEIAKYIDTSKWYSEDHVRQLHMLDETMKELKAGSPGGKLGKKLRNLDIATQMFKAGVTIYRPGHHTRNAIGDIWLASMDGVTPQYYARSSKILLANRAKDHSFDALRSLAPVGGPDKVKNILTMTYKGETRHFTEAQVYQMMKNAGGLPTFDIIEDVSLRSTELDPRKATGIIGAIQERAHLPGSLENKAHKVATGVSENREHWIRIAHWLHAMEHSPLRGKTFDEAIKNATFDSVSRVRKWHPDGSDLTKFERTYMRRIIPFYSWIRKAIPLVIETAIQKPGKVLLYPKAMYDWAEAQGIDLQSYGNPFPADQQFPSWIADQTQGPQWGSSGAYAGLNPGIPSADVADQYLANPGQLKNTVLGSLNPLARIPIELMSGNKLRTGGPIGDKSDYIDQQLPMGSYIDRLMGNRSLSTGFTQPNYEAPSNVGYENQSLPPGTGFLNWLTGAGITDFSKPSYAKFAQLEQKKAARG